MPLRHKSAQKRARQNRKRTAYNKLHKSRVKTAIKKVLSSKTKESGESELKSAVSVIDRVAVKGIIHKNKAAHTKSRLVKYVNTLK